jgi:membrane protein YdbS with pleckstrin-like domain
VREPTKRLDGRVLVMWWAIAGAVGVAATAAAVGAVVADLVPTLVPYAVGAGAVVVGVGGPLLRYRRWRYEIRERDLFLSRGGVFVTRTLIPFDRIQFVETREGPLDHAFGLQQLVVYTAAGRAGLIPGLAAREAELVREELSAVAGVNAV